MKIRTYLYAAMLTMCSFGIASAQTAKNVLFYGNSFTIATGFGSTQTVPLMVRDIAVAAGHPMPRNVNPSVAGQSLAWHLTNFDSTKWINQGINATQNWDAVVLQDYSTQPTHIGDLSSHRAAYKALYELVRARSPNAKAIGYETWARGPGHSYYAGTNPTFASPAAMQAELRNGYALSTADVNAAYGAGTSIVAPAGDAWEDAGFPLGFYASDIYHASNKGSLLNAMVLYGRIYGDNTIRDINLSAMFTNLGISSSDGLVLAGLAEGVLPEPVSLGLVGLAVVVLRRRRA